jgi:PAS domain S-box-containing protein
MSEKSYGELLKENEALKRKLEKIAPIKKSETFNTAIGSNSVFNQILNNTPESIIITDPTGIILFWNTSAEKIFGWKSEEVIGRNIIEYTPTLYSKKQADEIMDSLAKGNSWQGEFHVKNKNDEEFWVEIQNSPIYNSDGSLYGILGSSYIIDKRKKFERELKSTERKFKYVLDNIPLIALMFDLNGNISYANDYFLELSGWQSDEIIGANWVENFIDPEDIATINELFKSAIAEKNPPTHFVNNIVIKDGSKRRISWSNIVLFNDEGETEFVSSMGQDITDKHRMEMQLSDSEEKYRKLVENSPTGILTIDTEGNILDVNPKLIEILGSPSEEQTKKINFFNFKPLTDAGIVEVFRRSIEEKKPIIAESPYESKWGKKSYLRYHIIPILDSSGIVEKIQATVEDFTENKKTENALRESQNRFELFMNYLPASAFIKDEKNNLIYGNKMFAAQICKTPEELINHKFEENISEDIQNEFDVENYQVIHQKEIVKKEHKFVYEGIETHWITYKFPIPSVDGSTLIGAISIDMTETVQARDKMRFQSMLLDQIRDMVVATDLEGKVTYANKAVEKSMKLSQEELTKMSVRDFGESPLEGVTQEEIIRHTLENGQWQGEVVNFDKSGNKIFIDFRTTLIHDESSKPIGMLGISTDITQRKKVDLQLQKTKNMLQKAQSLAHVGSWEINLKTGETIWSDEFFRICGYEPQSFVPSTGQGLSIIHPEDRKRAEQAISEAIEKGRNYSIEKRIVRPDGDVRYVMSQGEIVFDSNKEPEYIIGSFLDITDRKKIELALENRIFALTQPDMPLGSLKLTDLIGVNVLQEIQDHFAESFDIPSIIYDLEGNDITTPSNFSDFCQIVRSSPKGFENCKAFDKQLAAELSDKRVPVIKRSCSVNDMITGTVPIIVEGRHLANFTCGQMIDHSFDLDLVWKYAKKIDVDPDNLVASTETLKRLDMESFQKIVDFLSVLAKQISDFGYQNLQQARFIAEQKRFEKELLEAKDKAEESDRLKTAFLANMSHEIRTPMNGIIGFSQLLLDENVTNEEINEYATIINSNANQLLSLINDIIDLAKIESGEMKVNPQSISINNLVQKVQASFSKQASDKGLEILYKCSEELKDISIISDEVKITQILNNLLSNAIKFTDKGSITIGCKVFDKIVRFFVRDTGIGLAEDQLEKVFSRFYQVENYITKTKRGTGLGLSITKALVEMLGGRIWCESQDGNGTVFYFEINYLKSDKEDEKQESAMLDFKELSKKEFTTLVVEDDETNMILFKRILSGTKAKVITAVNGKEAIARFKENPEIDIVLMDLKMPVMNGFEATRQIKQLSPDTPIIAQTAYAFSNDATDAMEAGCDDYISKPLDIEKLLSKIAKHLK